MVRALIHSQTSLSLLPHAPATRRPKLFQHSDYLFSFWCRVSREPQTCIFINLSKKTKNNWNLSFDLLGNASCFVFILQAFFFTAIRDRVLFFLFSFFSPLSPQCKKQVVVLPLMFTSCCNERWLEACPKVAAELPANSSVVRSGAGGVLSLTVALVWAFYFIFFLKVKGKSLRAKT